MKDMSILETPINPEDPPESTPCPLKLHRYYASHLTRHAQERLELSASSTAPQTLAALVCGGLALHVTDGFAWTTLILFIGMSLALDKFASSRMSARIANLHNSAVNRKTCVDGRD